MTRETRRVTRETRRVTRETGRELEIAQGEDGRTLISFLRRRLPRLPLSALHRMIRTGAIRVNGRPARPSRRLLAGDRVRLPLSEADFASVAYRPPSRPAGGLPAPVVLARGSDWIAVAKPAGLLTHAPDPHARGPHGGRPGKEGAQTARRAGDRRGRNADEADSLVARVLAHEPGPAGGRRLPSPGAGAFPPAPVHRLDRGTSGVVLFGLTSAARRRLAAAFRDRRAEKRYLALLPADAEDRVVRARLERDRETRRSRAAPFARGATQRTVQAGGEGRADATEFRVLARGPGACLALVRPHGGRTHQIRAHAALGGMPLLGDRKYGGRPIPGHRGYFLHAFEIWTPETGTVRCPLPREWKPVMKALGLAWPPLLQREGGRVRPRGAPPGPEAGDGPAAEPPARSSPRPR